MNPYTPPPSPGDFTSSTKPAKATASDAPSFFADRAKKGDTARLDALLARVPKAAPLTGDVLYSKADIERLVELKGTSVNQFVTMAAAEKLAAPDTQDYFRARVARADLAEFDRIMSRAGGEPSREGDERVPT